MIANRRRSKLPSIKESDRMAKITKLMVSALIICLCMCNVMVNADGETERVEKLDLDCMDGNSNSDSDWNDDWHWNLASEDFCDIKIWYQITNHSDNHYNVDVTLENRTEERIDNWEIRIPANYKIENIWNATIIDHIDDEYTIHNAEFNQDIAAYGSVTFGMTVECSEQVKMPVYVFTTGISNRLEETEYKIEFRRQSRKDGKFDGQIIITNLSEKPIEDWHMSFDCNFEINQIWNAVITEDIREEDLNYYVLENPGYHQNIAPRDSLEFRFTAACDGKPKISCIELYEITSDIDLSDEEDEQYLNENGYTDEYLIELG